MDQDHGRTGGLPTAGADVEISDPERTGAGPFRGHAEYLAWARVMRAEFNSLRDAEAVGAPTLLDGYGATNPTEFFAVATEAFFERPRALRARHPELYAELKGFYRQDPVAFSSEAAG